MKKSYIISKKEVNKTIPSKEIYQKNKELFREISKIKQEYKLSDKDLLNLINKQILIPISIFFNSSPLESLVKYLKENLNLNFHEIARLLSRDQRTIWVTYNNINKKNIELNTKSKLLIPIEIFSNRKLSSLENLVSYLLNLNYSFSQISNLLNRDYRTIWTCHQRAKKKNAEHK